MMSATILVAEDDGELRETVAWCLRVEGYRVITAADGREALRQLRMAGPELVILDVRMPSLDGLGVIAHMRQDPGLQRIPVVVLTGFPGDAPSDLVVLAKPFSGTRLLETVAAILGGPEARRRVNTPRGALPSSQADRGPDSDAR